MQGRKGFALFNVLMFAAITTIMMVAGIQFTQAALKEGRTLNIDQNAYQVAFSGINHALMWLQVHRSEAPTAFDPRVIPTEPDIEAETTTADEQLGIVREFEIDHSKELWGRYEIARSQDAPARDALTAGPSHSLYPTAGSIYWSVDDVGLARGTSRGSIWRARSRGYLYKRADHATASFTVASPAPIKAVTLEGEIKNFNFNIPRAAVYSFKDGSDTATPHLNFTYAGAAGAGNTEIGTGGATAVQHIWCNTATANVSKAANVSWSGGNFLERVGCSSSSSSYYVSSDLTTQLRNVFGVANSDGIMGLADVNYTLESELPSPTNGMMFIYLNPDDTRGLATFNAATPLRGEGVLFVDGSIEIKGTTSVSHYWHGLIFATGHYTQTGASTVRGAVMAGQSVTIGGNDSSKAKVIYDQGVLDRASEKFAGYRIDRSTLKIIGATTATY